MQSSPVTPATDCPIHQHHWGEPAATQGAALSINIAPELVHLHCASYNDDAGTKVEEISLDDLESGLFGDALPAPRSRAPSESNSAGVRMNAHLASLSRRFRSHTSMSISTGQFSSRSSSVGGTSVRDFASHLSTSTRPARSTVATAPPSPIPRFLTVCDDPEPIDRQELAATPLLPPKVGEPTKGLLPSPEIGPRPQTFPQYDSPHENARRDRYSEPTTGTLAPVTLRPTTFVMPPPDAWSNRLGHANFTIQPEPYMPTLLDARACRRLARDWEEASIEWLRHQARTMEHYGANSRTYRLTVEKWAEVDARWKRCIDEANALVAAQGAGAAGPPASGAAVAAASAAVAAACSGALSSRAAGPAAGVVTTNGEIPPTPEFPDGSGAAASSTAAGAAGRDAAPAKHVLHLDGGKFPRLGDADIVGPMERLSHGSDGESPTSLCTPAPGKAPSSAPASIALAPAPAGRLALVARAAHIKDAVARKAGQIGSLFGRGGR